MSCHNNNHMHSGSLNSYLHIISQLARSAWMCVFFCALFHKSHINFTTLNDMFETCLLHTFMPLYNRNVLSYKWKWCCLICINKIIIWIYSHRIICKMSAICLVVLLSWDEEERRARKRKKTGTQTHIGTERQIEHGTWEW